MLKWAVDLWAHGYHINYSAASGRLLLCRNKSNILTRPGKDPSTLAFSNPQGEKASCGAPAPYKPYMYCARQRWPAESIRFFALSPSTLGYQIKAAIST
jgi:hypothetical protein